MPSRKVQHEIPSCWIKHVARMPQRGELVQTPGGARGFYVGTTRGGIDWIAYEYETFAPMCEAFDARRN